MRRLVIIIIFTSLSTVSFAQQKWNLQSIVDYAMVNNINVKLQDVQARIAAIKLK